MPKPILDNDKNDVHIEVLLIGYVGNKSRQKLIRIIFESYDSFTFFFYVFELFIFL